MTPIPVDEYDTSGADIKTYGYKPGSTWTTDPLFMKEGISYYFYHNDQLGTPQKLTTTNGAVVWSATYTSFGEATVDISFTITNNLRFAGQYYDKETGLLYNYHRYYDPRAGRYLTSDPVGLDGGINLFAYVDNNPVKSTDPLGLRKRDITDVPCPLGTPIAIWSFRSHMKGWFRFEHGRGMNKCKELRGIADKYCIESSIKYGICFDLNSCKDRVGKCYDSCKESVMFWKRLEKNYSIMKSIGDYYKYTEMEALKHYSEDYNYSRDKLSLYFFLCLTGKSV